MTKRQKMKVTATLPDDLAECLTRYREELNATLRDIGLDKELSINETLLAALRKFFSMEIER